MFVRGDDGVYRSSLLSRESWLEHGFGSRNAQTWPGDYARVKQIHSAVVLDTNDLRNSPEPPQADGLITSESGVWVGIRTADCVPILLADPVNRCVGAVHAGWRGTADNIAAEAVQRM